MTSLIAYYGGLGLVAIALGLVLIALNPKRDGKARCHHKIAWNMDATVFCHMPRGHAGECCAPLSEFERAGYYQPPF